MSVPTRSKPAAAARTRPAPPHEAARSAPKAKTFRECAIAYIATQAPAWALGKACATVDLDASKTTPIPSIGDRAVDAVDQTAVIDILNQIDPRKPEAGTLWSSKPETASRLRGRIESVLGWATVAGFRSGDNPAAWRGRLQHVFPARTKVRAVEHHAAMPYKQVPAFMAKLRSRDTTSSRALQFTILTAAQERRNQRREVVRDRSPGEALDRPRRAG